MKKLFTFWEPKEAFPGYVKLCMKTWRRCLPGYEIVILDFDSLGRYLTAEEQAAISCPEMSLAMQADCIRCALLKKHGGIWLDADTILTKSPDERFFASDVSMVARREDGRIVNYGAYIYAAHPEAKIIVEWYRQLLPRIRKARRLKNNLLLRLLDRGGWKDVRSWDYFENAILDPLTLHADRSDYACVDKDGIGAFPEESMMDSREGVGPHEAYVRYWFSPGEPDGALRDCAGMIMLHNSWTPKAFRTMPEDAFMRTDTRLAALFRRSGDVN